MQRNDFANTAKEMFEIETKKQSARLIGTYEYLVGSIRGVLTVSGGKPCRFI